MRTPFAAEEHLAEEHFSLKKQTMNTENYLMYRARNRRRTAPKTEGTILDPTET
jgi:hypothetical protein